MSDLINKSVNLYTNTFILVFSNANIVNIYYETNICLSVFFNESFFYPFCVRAFSLFQEYLHQLNIIWKFLFNFFRKIY